MKHVIKEYVKRIEEKYGVHPTQESVYGVAGIWTQVVRSGTWQDILYPTTPA